MKRVELESFVKSFILFFISQLLLTGVIFYVDYKKEIKSEDENIFSKMRICSFNLTCKEFKIDFAPLQEHELYKLYKNETSLSSYFSIPNSTKNALKIYLPKKKYDVKIQKIQNDFILRFIIVVIVIIILSIIFSIYTISPLRNALRLTEEFVKDILHDFNTPLSTLRLNAVMLKDEIGNNAKITRIENSVQNILSLQSNLRSYLDNHATQKESFNLQKFLQERVAFLDKNYKYVKFEFEVADLQINTNKEAFARVIDNLLTNAAKYNKQDGRVLLSLEKNTLKIQDTGKGIQNPKKVFDRFYKEQDRGIGIGLHIVKKLCEELGIAISLKTELNVGSSFLLDLKMLTLH